MATIGNIQSISEGHSIKEVVASFVVQPTITEPLLYKDLISNNVLLGDPYTKYEPIKNVSVNFNQQTEEATVENVRVDGFKLLSFKDGEIENLIQGINQFDKGIFTFNTLKYTHWNDFWDKAKKNLRVVAEHQPIYNVKSFGLLYIDEFRTINPNEFNISQIFNVDSRYIPQTIIDGDLLEYNVSYNKQMEGKQWAENIIVKIDKKQNVINIINNISFAIIQIPFTTLIKDIDVDSYMLSAHNRNKILLKDLLKSDISEMIGL